MAAKRRKKKSPLLVDIFSEEAESSGLNDPQPPPKPSQHPSVWMLVRHDMMERDSMGQRKYGQALTPHDGRDSLVDAYQEVLDLAVYLRKAIYERDGR